MNKPEFIRTSVAPFKARYGNFINGRWIEPSNGRYFENHSPVNGQLLCEVARSDAADVEAALDAAHAAKHAWGRTSAAERALLLNRMADVMDENLPLLATAETWDNGKPIRETTAADLPLAIDHFRYFAGAIRAQEGGISEIDHDTVAYHFHEPLGVVGQIIPWNFPLLMAVWKLAPALAAGNCVVLKPAEQTPASILVLAELIADILPPGVLNIVNGFGLEAGKPLASSNRIAKIAFTGETSTGRLIMQYASQNLIPVTLELGGKSPNIFFSDVAVEDDDYLDKAIEGFVMFALNQGEVCTCPSRALVHEKIYGRFMEKALKRVAAIKQGDPLDPATMIGAQASSEQLEKILGYFDIGRKEGAEVLAGGSRCELPGDLAGGYYVRPTVLKGHNKMRVFQEEIFGPVVSVTKWLNLEETASRLGVEVTSMKRLLDAGHLDGITSDNPRVEGSAGSALWRISPDTVDGFIEKLARTLVPSQSPSFSLIEASLATSKSLTNVVGLILRGHLSVCAIDKKVEGLARLKVRVVDVKAALQKDRGDTRTFLEASAEIGLTPAAAKEVRDAGYLPFKKTGRRYSVSKQDIDEFNAHYTTSSKLAETFGLLGWQSADQLLKTIGIKPVGDRDFDKRFIYHRAETEEAIRGWSGSQTKAESYSAGGWLTAKHALNKLQLPYGFGMELIAAGILPSEENSRGRRLSEEAVNEFKSRYMTTLEAGELLGCSAQKAIQALREEKVVAAPPDYSSYLYERESALAVIERLNSVVVEEPPRFEFDPEEHLTASQITELVGINRDTITFLEKKGILTSVRDRLRYYFSATQLAAFRERYLSGKDLVEALEANTKDPGMNPVWFSKRLGLKPAFGPPDIKAYIFDRVEFVEAVRQYEVDRQAEEDRQAKIAEIPVLASLEAAKRLRLVPAFFSRVVRAGLLNGEERKRCFVFTLDEIERFERTYILATEASEFIGKKGSMTAVAALQRLGVAPIAPYSELGGYIYNREQALHALDRLTHNSWSAA